MSVDKKINYDVQGGIRNYLGKQKTISNVPLKWKSGPGHPKTELAYITQAEKDLLIKKDLHNSLKNGPNKGPGGIISLNNDGIGDTGGPGSGGSENAGTDDKGNSMGGGTGPSVQAPPGVRSNPTAPTDGTEGTLSDPREKFDFVGNTKFGPTQKYTGGGFFSGANEYGYRDVDTNPFSKNYGDTKPGYAGRIIGGLGSLLTGIPFVGGALGTAYDYGKGIFGPKQKDMSQFNNLGLYSDRFPSGYGIPTQQGDYDLVGNKINEITGEIKSPTGESLGFIPGYPGGSDDSGITTLPTGGNGGNGGSDQYLNLIKEYIPDDPVIPDEAFSQRFKVKDEFRKAKGDNLKAEDKAIQKTIEELYT